MQCSNPTWAVRNAPALLKTVKTSSAAFRSDYTLQMGSYFMAEMENTLHG